MLELLVGLALSIGAAGQAFAQSGGLDPLEILRGLTPEQQQEILRRVGGGDSGRIGDRGDRARDVLDGEDANRERRLREALEEREEAQRPKLRGDDTVIIQIGFPGTIRRRVEPAATAAGLPGDATRMGAVVAATGQFPQGQTAGQGPVGQPPPEPQVQEPPLTTEEEQRLRALIDLVRSRNPYRLDRNGVLHLPGFPGIALAGLTELQATLRLSVEPAFQRLDLELTHLPLRKQGPDGLEPFGYDMFQESPSTFAPVTEVPVPSDYIVGPGDELEVQLYGNQNRRLALTVGRDGRVSFPELGPITVAGQRFSQVRSDIEARVQRQIIGVRASVSMGETRAIRVFVLGEAKFPGTYTVSGLASITSALFAAGGVKPIGSLRNIQLKRQGRLMRRLDLYDVLTRGDTSDDARLLPGDVIFIPPVGPTVAVDGEVRRPAIYELSGEVSLEQLLQIAGGLTPEADPRRVSLTRIDEQRRRVVLSVDASSPADSAQELRNGDLLRVPRLRPTLDSGIVVQGQVHRPGSYAWREGLRLTDVIGSVDELMPSADQHYLLIRRELAPDRRVSVLSADLVAALRAPGTAADLPLMPRDRVTVFDLETSRERVIRPILAELRLQSRIDRPTEVVSIGGRVKAPGEYPLEPGMKVSDLIRAGGGLEDAAYGGKAELTRYSTGAGEQRRTELITIDLDAMLRGEAAADLALQPFDSLSVKEVPSWGEQEQVEILGEVRFPGVYTVRRDETLRSVIERAGGLTELAFPQGAVFTRRELREREQEQLDSLARRLQSDITVLALQGAAANQGQAAQALSVGQALLGQLRESEAVGRLVIDLETLVAGAPGGARDVLLRDGDRLIVPKIKQEVTVIGEVQSATSHFYRADLERADYIALSGGVTRKADEAKIYVVRANGRVVSGEGNRWFRSAESTRIQPGDTVVVPLDTERLPALPFWQAVTGIIYNLAIAAAAVNSF